MTVVAPFAGSARTGEGAPSVLAPEERRRISSRLGAGLVGCGLLGVGTLLVRLEPDQWQIGELCRGLAALVVGVPTLLTGLRGVVTGDTRRATDQLVAIAVLAAAATGDFVTATLIPLLLELGRLFEERSSLGARAAIDGIRALAARQAMKWHDGKEEAVDPTQLKPGDEILVRPGERIAVDGTVLDGRPQWINRRSPANRCTKTWAQAAQCLLGRSRSMDCFEFRCAARAPTRYSGVSCSF